MRNPSIELLNKLTAGSNDKREKRSRPLLKKPENDFIPNWFMIVPSYFNNALDIKLTEIKINKVPEMIWTQGNAFSFDIGDVIYFNENTEENTIHYIQIQSATPVAPKNGENARYPGHIYFWEMKYNIQLQILMHRKDWVMSQDEFIGFLIAGN